MAGEMTSPARERFARDREMGERHGGRPSRSLGASSRRFAPKPSARVSERERAIFTELARGMSTDEIAAALHVSPHTVRTHIKNGMRKLDARTRAHAVAIAICDGLINI
jgi:DNA-binding CsgD family transcriptional regulator